jgi:hypothetical protein
VTHDPTDHHATARYAATPRGISSKERSTDSRPAKRRFVTTNATNEDEIEVSLDGVARPREEVIKAVERSFGRPVLRTSDAGLQNLRRRTR